MKTLTQQEFDDALEYLRLLNQVLPCKDHKKINCMQCLSAVIRSTTIKPSKG